MGHDASAFGPPTKVDDKLVEEIANEADTDKRSVIRRLAGLEVRGRAGRRIDAALAKRRPCSAA
jgi:hypothetical protein